MSSAQQVVQEFLDSWPEADAAKLASYFSNDAIYHNIPMEPVRGRPAIDAALAGFVASVSNIVFETLHIAGNGDVVLTERVDRFESGGRQVNLPVMGVFEIRGGKIAAWRDYFDLKQYQTQTGR